MLAQYNEIAHKCNICNVECNYKAHEFPLYFCNKHFIYIPLIRWQLFKTIQIYIPANIVCTYGFDINKMELNNNITNIQVALFREDSLHERRSFSMENKYPIYLNISNPNNLYVKMFYIFNGDNTDMYEQNVDINLSRIEIASPISAPLRSFAIHMYEKLREGLWIPIITEPLYSKLPLVVKKLITTWGISYMNLPNLFKLSIRILYQHDLLTDDIINKLPIDIREKIYEIPDNYLSNNAENYIKN